MGSDTSKINPAKMPKYYVKDPIVSAQICGILVRSLRTIVGNVGIHRSKQQRLPFLVFYDIFYERLKFLDACYDEQGCLEGMDEKSLFLAKLLKLLVQVPQNTLLCQLPVNKLDPASLSQLKAFANEYYMMKLTSWALVGDALFYAVSQCDELYIKFVDDAWACAYSIFLRHFVPIVLSTRKRMRKRGLFPFSDADDFDLSQVVIPDTPRRASNERAHTISHLRVQTDRGVHSSIATSPRHKTSLSASLAMSARMRSASTYHTRTRSLNKRVLKRAMPIMFEQPVQEDSRYDNQQSSGISSRELHRHLREIWTISDQAEYSFPEIATYVSTGSSESEDSEPEYPTDMKHEVLGKVISRANSISRDSDYDAGFLTPDYCERIEEPPPSTGTSFSSHSSFSSISPLNRSRNSSREKFSKKYKTLPLDVSQALSEQSNLADEKDERDSKTTSGSTHILLHSKVNNLPRLPHELDLGSLTHVFRSARAATQKQMLRRYST